jgi:hypothetical protein
MWRSAMSLRPYTFSSKTPRSLILEQRIIIHVFKKNPLKFEYTNCSCRLLATVSSCKPEKSILHLYAYFNIYSHLRLGLQNYLFRSGFPTKILCECCTLAYGAVVSGPSQRFWFRHALSTNIFPRHLQTVIRLHFVVMSVQILGPFTHMTVTYISDADTFIHLAYTYLKPW